MKKIMILLLSLAVLFSFAACDNSSSEPSGDETTPVGPNNADKFVADQLNTYFTDIATRLAKVYAASTAEDGAKVGTDEVSLTYTFVDTKAVGSTPATLVTVTVKGTDVSADKDAAVRDVRLESYTMNAKGYKDEGTASVLSYDVVNLTGKLQGSVQITKAVTTPAATPASINGSITIDRVFAPTAVGSVSVTDANGTYDVDTENFFAQMDAKCTGADLDATYILESVYTAKMKESYATAIKGFVAEFATGLTGTGLNALLGEEGVSAVYTAGTDSTAATVVITYNIPGGESDTDVAFGTSSGDVDTSLQKGTTFKVTLAAAKAGVTQGTTLTLDGGSITVNEAHLVATDAAAAAVVDGTKDLDITGLVATLTTASVTVPENGGELAKSAITSADAPTTFTAGTATVTDATVAADVTVTSTETVTYAAN